MVFIKAKGYLEKIISILIFRSLKFKHLGKNVIWGLGKISGAENIIIGDNVYIGSENRLNGKGGLEIKSGVIIGPRVTIHTTNHNYKNAKSVPYDEKVILKKVIINKNCWIGDSVKIVPGVTIGEGCIVGMGSVITKDIPAFSLVGGNPAKIIRKRSDIKNYNKNKNKIYLKIKKEKKSK